MHTAVSCWRLPYTVEKKQKKKTVHTHYRVQVFMCTSFCREPDGLCQRQSSEEAQTFLF